VPSGSSQLPPHLSGLVDDAPSLTAGEVPQALGEHRGHLASTHADLVGAFVVDDRRLGELPQDDAEEQPGRAPVLRVRVGGGAGAIAPAVSWARGTGLALRGLDLAMRQSDAGDLAPNARRIVAALDDLLATGSLDEETEVHVEPPPLYGGEPTASWLDALDELAAAEHRLLLRTAPSAPEGLGAQGPSALELATCIGAALDREMALAATGGVGLPVTRRDADTGRGQHGFLNLLVATRVDLDGASLEDVARVLEETDPEGLMSRTDAAGLASARRWLTSVRSERVLAAWHDLVELGLLETR
jgi:hypothetical protein